MKMSAHGEPEVAPLPAVRMIRTLASSGYVKAVATLSTGQFLATAIPMIAAPVQGRLYLPGDYGVLATYMAMANVMGVLGTLQLARGIVIEGSDRRAVALIHVCLWASIGMAVIAAGVAILAFFLSAEGSAYVQVRGWLLLLPLSTIAAGTTAAIAALANRSKRYHQLARIQMISTIVSVTFSIVLGLVFPGPHGLLIGYFAGQATTIVNYLRLYRHIVPRPPRYRHVYLANLALRHRNFALFTLPAELLGTLNLQLPVLAMSAIGAIGPLGSFSRARQLVSMPMSLVGSSIAQVFQQQAAEQYHNEGSCRRIFGRTFLVLTVIGAPPILFLLLFAPDIFRIVLGPNWIEAGYICRILAPTLLLGFICSPLSTVFYIYNAQRSELVMMSVGSAVMFAAIGACILLRPSPTGIVVIFAAGYALIYLAFLLRSWQLVTTPPVRKP